MRFMMLVKSQKSGAPPKEFMDAMAKLAEQAAKDGSLVASGGLAPIAASTRVRLAQGKIMATDGPFAETKEVIGGYAVMDFKSKQDAVEGALRFMELHQKHWPGWEGETEIRQVQGPEEFATKA
ncbi:MAG: YciI family protein [Candidatus Acidiferrales bacterium]